MTYCCFFFLKKKHQKTYYSFFRELDHKFSDYDHRKKQINNQYSSNYNIIRQGVSLYNNFPENFKNDMLDFHIW